MGISVETLTLAKAFTKEYVDEHSGGAAVKEIHEYDEYAYFPSTGSTDELYVDKSTGRLYRWSGSMYVEVSGEKIREYEVAANNGKILSVQSGSFVMVSPDTLFQNGDSIQY